MEMFLSIRTFIDESGVYTLFNQNKVSVFSLLTKSGNLRNVDMYTGQSPNGLIGGLVPVMVSSGSPTPSPGPFFVSSAPSPSINKQL